MSTKMAKCPECYQLVPADRLEEHLYIHQKYGTAARKQKTQGESPQPDPEPVVKQTRKAAPERYVTRAARVPASPRIDRTADQDRDVPIKPETGHSKPEETPAELKTKIINGKVYVDRMGELQAVGERFRRQDSGTSERNAQQVPGDPVLESLENFQDFLLYAAENRLAQREMDMLCQRCGLLDGKGRTLQEVAHIFGLSRERIRQLINRSLRKIVGTGTRQLNRKQWKKPCAMLVAYVRDAIRHGEEGDLERFINFAEDELPHLKLWSALPLLGYFFGDKKGVQHYRDHLSQRKYELEKLRHAERLEEMLAFVIWPDRLAEVNSNHQLEFKIQRNISTKSKGHAGYYFSEKMQRDVGYESELEHRFFERLEAFDAVVFFQEQPLQIPYIRNGKSCTYFPDVFFALIDGRGIVAEVVPSQGMALQSNWVKWSALKTFCRHNGYGLLVTNGRKSIQEVSRQEIRPRVRQQVLDALDNGSLNWSQYKQLRHQCAIKTSELYALIIQERLRWQPRPFCLERVIE